MIEEIVGGKQPAIFFGGGRAPFEEAIQRDDK
jgi:hypothetical protein